jgi:hypothetical protein
VSAAWFEEQPNESYKSRVEKSADREIEKLSKTTRRNLFSGFFSSWSDLTLTAGWASGLAAIAAVWLVSRNDQTENKIAVSDMSFIKKDGDMDLEFQKVSVDEFNLVADLELYEDLDFLDMISEEDLERGESES